MVAILFIGGHFFLAAILFLTFWLRMVKIYFHAKFQASSSKIERVMLNFVFCALCFLRFLRFCIFGLFCVFTLFCFFVLIAGAQVFFIFVLFCAFYVFYVFCSEMAAGGQDLLVCKILGF